MFFYVDCRTPELNNVLTNISTIYRKPWRTNLISPGWLLHLLPPSPTGWPHARLPGQKHIYLAVFAIQSFSPLLSLPAKVYLCFGHLCQRLHVGNIRHLLQVSAHCNQHWDPVMWIEYRNHLHWSHRIHWIPKENPGHIANSRNLSHARDVFPLQYLVIDC